SLDGAAMVAAEAAKGKLEEAGATVELKCVCDSVKRAPGSALPGARCRIEVLDRGGLNFLRCRPQHLGAAV
ncbi:MAG: hypothetical protein VXW98_06965, partial [Actinomycetota bacterium]|nr:hypothetical protein [Actinomycetota bacterium]